MATSAVPMFLARQLRRQGQLTQTIGLLADGLASEPALVRHGLPATRG